MSARSSTSKFKNRLNIDNNCDNIELDETNDIIVSNNDNKDKDIKTVFLEPQKHAEKSLSDKNHHLCYLTLVI